jgi:hypothetical protein
LWIAPHCDHLRSDIGGGGIGNRAERFHLLRAVGPSGAGLAPDSRSMASPTHCGEEEQMPEHRLTFQPTVIAGALLANDYSVFREAVLIGRIRLTNEEGWDWVINPPSDIPSWATGREKSLDRAKTALLNSWIGYHTTLQSMPYVPHLMGKRH